MKALLVSVVLSMGLVTSCTQPPPNPAIAELQKQMDREKKRLTDLDTEAKKPQNQDPGSQATMTEDKELILSRIARIQLQLERLGVKPATEGGGGDAQGHH